MILVDADACPVRAEAETVATRHRLPLAIVSNGGIRPSGNPLVQTVIVAEGPDAADDWIAGRAGVGDVVVTADIPLAARVIAKGARVVRHDGETYDTRNIGAAVALRDLMAGLRSADPFRQGGGRPYTRQDRSRFLDALERAVRQAMSQGS